jgi:hypothetical protein
VDDPRLSEMLQIERTFDPAPDTPAGVRGRRFERWKRAVARSIGWIQDDDEGLDSSGAAL